MKNDENVEKEISLEEAFERLDGIIGQMSDEDIALEESFKLYNEGISLVKLCNDRIEKVEHEIEILNADENESNGL